MSDLRESFASVSSSQVCLEPISGLALAWRMVFLISGEDPRICASMAQRAAMRSMASAVVGEAWAMWISCGTCVAHVPSLRQGKPWKGGSDLRQHGNLL